MDDRPTQIHRKRIRLTYVLRKALQGRLIDPEDDVTHVDQAGLGGGLPWKQLLDPDHAGAGGLGGRGLLAAEAEAQAGGVLQQAHLKHVVWRERGAQRRGPTVTL